MPLQLSSGVRQNDPLFGRRKVNEQLEPRPEEKGFLPPPNRRPPTTVGVSTPPPPHPPFRRPPKRRTRSLFQPLYVFTATSVVGGTALWHLAASIFLRAAGATFAVVGFFWLIFILWVNTGAAAAWSLWREHRWIQRRQKALRESSRTSA
jgi:hypothetical protein